MEKKLRNDGYKGFLHIRCQHCGTEKAFYTENRLKEHNCFMCGKNTELKGMKPMYVNCECGNDARYMTNMTAETFDTKCLNCKAPVAEVYNPIKGIYATIGFESKKKHKKRRMKSR